MDGEYQNLVEQHLQRVRDSSLDEAMKRDVERDVKFIMTFDNGRYCIGGEFSVRYEKNSNTNIFIENAIAETETLDEISFGDQASLECLSSSTFVAAIKKNKSILTMDCFYFTVETHYSQVKFLEFLEDVLSAKFFFQLKSIDASNKQDIFFLSLMHFSKLKHFKFLNGVLPKQHDLLSKCCAKLRGQNLEYVRYIVEPISYKDVKCEKVPTLGWYMSFCKGNIPLEDWRILVRLYKIIDPRDPELKQLFTSESVVQYIGQEMFNEISTTVLPQDILDVVSSFVENIKTSEKKTLVEKRVLWDILQANQDQFTETQIAEVEGFLSPASDEAPSAAASDDGSNLALLAVPSSSAASDNQKMLTDDGSTNPQLFPPSHDYALVAQNLIENYHHVKYIFDKVLGISSDSITISPEVRAGFYLAASALHYSSKDFILEAKVFSTIGISFIYYAKEKMRESISVNQDIDSVTKCVMYNTFILGAKSPLYYGMISNPATSSYGVKILLSDVVYSSATCINIYFNKENEGSTGSDMLSILMSGMIAYNALDSGTDLFSNVLLAINSFASAHMILNTIKDSGMNALQGLTNYFTSEEQADFAEY